MDKQQVVDLIKQKLSDGVISKNDLNLLINGQGSENIVNNITAPVVNQSVESESSIGEKLIHSLYAIGALILLIGIVILLVQNWTDIGFSGRILSTLGVSVISYVIALLLSNKEDNPLSEVLFAISAIVSPIGIYVLLRESGYEINENTFLIYSLILSVFFGITKFFSKSKIIILVTVFFSTSFYFSAIYKMFKSLYLNNFDDIIKIAVIVLGLAYFLIAYGYDLLIKNKNQILKMEDKAVSGVLYTLGSPAIIIPFMTYDGFFDFITLLIIFAIAYLGFIVRSKIVFFISSIALVIQISMITWEYFRNSIGWPIMLIIIGVVIIATAFVSINISKKINK